QKEHKIMKPLLEDLTYEQLQKCTKKELSERLTELEVPHDKKWTKDELIDLLRAEGGQFDEKEVQAVEAESYVVLHAFKDLEDKCYVYEKNSKYPRKANKEVTKQRVDELSSKKNKLRKQLIKERG